MLSPTGGTPSTEPLLRIQAVQIQPGAFISQTVPVNPGCCYTLSFAADVRDGGILVASVSFPALGQDCPPTIAEIIADDIPHIVPSSPAPQSGFQHFTLVICVPTGIPVVDTACITFQNAATPASPGGSAFVDNIVFQPTGGPCDSCTQNF
ncbi:hypothetical protein COL30_11460 [Bacillus pseudomycoides]|uniref:Uncharacterized protein n=1 Tax=Bacillus pseudomycoides TaxID=64104 RepID=A0A2C3V032_9BACI|nr:hypothetical protein CON79_02705 [Bacillus pseudomycoides]PEA81304.1 hypothetical protein CON99_23270 [Bacillus pseudomycoides]PED06367.1 hypothetical protein COO19_21175 [Bacillus pseudomycoides]PED72677.1 hypothetical protein CON97_07670 [Bacillus pseudomycoides]PEI39861.1 hypothetical protein CN620_17975 [Bacillus pseudomycoides]